MESESRPDVSRLVGGVETFRSRVVSSFSRKNLSPFRGGFVRGNSKIWNFLLI